METNNEHAGAAELPAALKTSFGLFGSALVVRIRCLVFTPKVRARWIRSFAEAGAEGEVAPIPAVHGTATEPQASLRLLGCLPLKNDAARSGGRRPRRLGGGNRGPAWQVGAAPAVNLWGFEIGA